MDLSALNKEQRIAAETLEGPVLILAGAGSGKTRTLTYRLANLLDHGTPAWSVMALTFTNKASREMKERIAALIGEEKAAEAWISTFHSSCARILRRDIEKLGYTRSFSIYDDEDQTNAQIAASYLQYVSATLETIGAHDQSNLILLEGNTAGWLIQQLTDGELLKPDAVILMNAFYRDRDANSMLAEYFSSFKGYTLDLVTTDSNNWLNEAFSRRKFVCEKQEKPKGATRFFKSEDPEETGRMFGRYLRKTDFSAYRNRVRRNAGQNR